MFILVTSDPCFIQVCTALAFSSAGLLVNISFPVFPNKTLETFSTSHPNAKLNVKRKVLRLRLCVSLFARKPVVSKDTTSLVTCNIFCCVLRFASQNDRLCTKFLQKLPVGWLSLEHISYTNGPFLLNKLNFHLSNTHISKGWRRFCIEEKENKTQTQQLTAIALVLFKAEKSLTYKDKRKKILNHGSAQNQSCCGFFFN